MVKKEIKMNVNETNIITEKIIGAAIEVHKTLGPGLLESVYEDCLAIELQLKKIKFIKQYRIPINYKGHSINKNLIIDLLVENQIIVELKSVEKLLPVHEAQLLTYLKLTDIKTGLLLNFNVALLKDGIKRLVN